MIRISSIFMKTDRQAIALLSKRGAKSEKDKNDIESLCKGRGIILRFFHPEINPTTGVTPFEFLDWLDNGYGNGEIALFDKGFGIISDTDLTRCIIRGYLDNDGHWNECELEYDNSQLSKLAPELQIKKDAELSRLGIEYKFRDLNISKKYKPSRDERVLFYNALECGVGAIREVDIENNTVELYCYYKYTDDSIGYSMHEKGIVTYNEYHFEVPSISTKRRLNVELGRFGKVWNEKLHRIEPVQPKVLKGERYWYIDDRMKLVPGIEKGTPTSHFRYIGGNYFATQAEGIDCLGRIANILRDNLAK